MLWPVEMTSMANSIYATVVTRTCVTPHCSNSSNVLSDAAGYAGIGREPSGPSGTGCWPLEVGELAHDGKQCAAAGSAATKHGISGPRWLFGS
jgi:hypothetical protein